MSTRLLPMQQGQQLRRRYPLCSIGPFEQAVGQIPLPFYAG